MINSRILSILMASNRNQTRIATAHPFSIYHPVIPAKAGIQKAPALWQAKPSMNRNQRIPSPLMGEG